MPVGIICYRNQVSIFPKTSNYCNIFIIFVLLLPNSIHLRQPLDIAMFRPIKEAWRTFRRLVNIYSSSLPKPNFPKLHKSALSTKMHGDLSSVFKAIGIFTTIYFYNLLYS